MFDVMEFRSGAVAFLIALGIAGVFTIAFKLIYSAVTPYNEQALIKSGNTAAAIVLTGAVIGYVLPVASALSNTASIIEFAAWATLAGVIQLVTFLAVRRLALPNIKEHIENNEFGPAIYLAGISICVGLLNAACMTY